MKWILTLTYLFSALLVTACTSADRPQQQAMTTSIQSLEEPLLTTQVRTLNWDLLQQPFFVQGAFEHGQRLYITYPSSTVPLPISHEELQRASAETLTQANWFDIQILAAQQQAEVETAVLSYSLIIRISGAESTPNMHTLTLELINNRFNTVEVQVNRVISL